ncbi:unnamed protein product [Ascophyllum nodosum]
METRLRSTPISQEDTSLIPPAGLGKPTRRSCLEPSRRRDNGSVPAPSGVTCSHCVVQMAHYTGNSCMHPGYEEFNPPSWPSKCAPNKGDWILTGLNMCGVGDSYPEEYWNCADIDITSGEVSGS